MYEPPNSAPTADPITTSTNEDLPLNIELQGSDPEGDSLTYSILSQPIFGTVTLSGAMATYSPETNYYGLDSLIYQVTDPSGLMATATVLITVIAVNDPPIANDESISTNEDTAVSIELSATDVDSLDVSSFSLISQPTHGSVFISGITATYTPEANYNGSDGFDYLVTDTGGLFDEATVSLTVTAINDSPFASNSTLSTLKNTQGTIDVRNVVSDIEDPDDALVYTVSTNANKGSTVSNNDGTFTYTTNEDFVGLDVFGYRIQDTGGLSADADITVTVFETNTPPIASADSVSTNEDTVIIVDVALLVSDEQDASSALAYSILSPPSNGEVVLDDNSSITYTPEENFNGSDSFSYEVTDTGQLSAQADIFITILAVNDAPTVEGQVVSTDEDVAIEIVLSGVDLDGDPLTFELGAAASNGLVSITDSVARYLPDANFFGEDSFTYLARDQTTTSQPAQVSISVLPTGAAQLQVINYATSADYATGTVFLGGALWLPVLEFGTASQTSSVADGPLQVRIEGLNGIFQEVEVDLVEDGVFALVFLDADPAFVLVDGIRDSSSGNGVSVRPFNAFIGASQIDFIQQDLSSAHLPISTLASALSFAEVAPDYIDLEAAGVNLATVTTTGETQVFFLDLSNRVGQAGILLAYNNIAVSSGLSLVFITPSGEVDLAVVSTGTTDPALPPDDFRVRSVFPNPSGNSVTLMLDLPESARVTLKIYDLLGREVIRTPSTQLFAGDEQLLTVSSAQLASGIYLHRVIAVYGSGRQEASGRLAIRR